MIVSLYIRKADEQKWKQLQNKTALISDLLNASSISNDDSNISGEPINPVPVQLRKEVPFDILKQGKGGRYNGDSPIAEELLPKRSSEMTHEDYRKLSEAPNDITDKDINDISDKMDKQEKPDVVYPVVKPPKIIKTKEDAEAWVGPLSKQHSARKKSNKK